MLFMAHGVCTDGLALLFACMPLSQSSKFVMEMLNMCKLNTSIDHYFSIVKVLMWAHS